MAKYVHRSGFVEAEKNMDGTYTINGVTRITEEQFKQEFIAFPTSITARWDFIYNQNLCNDPSFANFRGTEWENCFTNGFECSHCHKGGSMGISAKVCSEQDEWKFHDERTPFCPNCGAKMINWEETYEEWKERNEKLQRNA